MQIPDSWTTSNINVVCLTNFRGRCSPLTSLIKMSGIRLSQSNSPRHLSVATDTAQYFSAAGTYGSSCATTQPHPRPHRSSSIHLFRPKCYISHRYRRWSHRYRRDAGSWSCKCLRSESFYFKLGWRNGHKSVGAEEISESQWTRHEV